MTIQSYQNVSLSKYRREAQNVILHDLHPLSNFNDLKLNETFGATIIVVPHFATEKFCFEVFAPMNHICNMIFCYWVVTFPLFCQVLIYVKPPEINDSPFKWSPQNIYGYPLFCLLPLVLFVLSKSLWQSREDQFCQKLKISSVIRLRF